MRIAAVLFLALLVTAGCGDDGDASPPSTSTVNVEGTTPSTTTTEPGSTTTVAEVETTTTAAPETTLPPPSTTEPERFEAYTTAEMEDELADSHVYLGGWIVDEEFSWAVEQWGQGGVGDPAGWYATGGDMELWVSSLVERTPDGIPVWQRTDLVITTYRPEDGLAISGSCRLGGDLTAGVVAWYPVEDGADQWTPAVEAWRIDFETGRMAPINAGVVDCENEMFGL